jgi:hypothetical protein
LQIRDRFDERYFDFVLEALKFRGFNFDPQSSNWNVTWCVHYPPERYLQLKDWQKVSNLPAIKHIAG